MTFTPRTYQVEAIDRAVDFMNGDSKGNGLLVLPTGSGKSVVIANMATRLSGNTLVLQPSKEILEQNYAKYTSYGYRAAKYAASVGEKYVDQVTFAMIGSVIRKKHLFRDFKNIIIDECHLVNSDEGMYYELINYMRSARVLGLTATPYRLSSGPDGACLNFITNTSPRIFTELLYYVQNEVLFSQGHLAKLEYFNFNKIDTSQLKLNSSGSDFTEASLRAYYRQIGMHNITIAYARDLLKVRKNLLIFCTLIDEAQKVAAGIPGAVVITGDTDTYKRAAILADFKSGKIRCLINVGVLTTGFDFPELDTVLMARDTLSLSIYYQVIGRVMRPHPLKLSGWFVDLGGNISRFGKIETMKIQKNRAGQYSVWNIVQGEMRQLTDVAFSWN